MGLLKDFLKDRRLWLLSIAVFLLLILVFDRNNLIEVWRLKQKNQALEDQKSYYEQRIAEDSATLENLKRDDYMEQYAREHYLMKKQDEVIYLVR